ncbi:MAG TPA: Gfo/Idh/MocA family oxidoreductase [Thermoanaerobaculia bacterium]|nr:Gfo/Idh/MocA family oxidoreductase [Thermoanaerobaculia bacterium]
MRAEEGTDFEIGLAGCGRWGKRILADLVGLGACVRVADPSDEARRGALAAGAREAVPDVASFGRIDAAIVATPTLEHSASIDALAGRRIPIFCEKPLTADAASAHRLADALDGRLWVLAKWRWHPAIEAIAAIARTGELGPPRALRTRRRQPSISGYDVDPVWVLAPHELSIASEVLGELPSIARAQAAFDGGKVTALNAEADGAVAFSFEVSVRAPDRKREVELLCRDGRVLWSSEDEHAIRVGGQRRSVDPDPPLRRELRAIREFLRGGPPPKTGAREGAAAVAVLERAREIAGITPSGRRSR